MLKLRIEDDEGQEKIVPIIRDEITIGRQEGNTIRLTERNVSRRHARLIREGEELWVEEISARYGTLKNGERIVERVPFGASDMIRIGDYSLTLQTDAPIQADSSSDFAAEPTAIKPLSGAPSPRRAHEGTEILPAMPAKLVIISSNFAGQEFPLSRKQMIIGRGDDCDIIIDHRSVSQRHAKIVRENGTTYQIVDLNSKNGIRISGEKYTSTYIKRGDIVELGHVKFRFVEAGENYIFTPQSVDDDESTQFMAAPTSSGSKNTAIIGGIGLLVLVALIAVAVVAMSGDKDTPDDPGHDPDTAITGVDTTATEPDDTLDEPASNEKIGRGIKESKELIAAGDVTKAIGTLEGLLKYADPTPSEKEKITEMLTQARNERPFEDTFTSISKDLEDKDYLSVLEDMDKLPEHSLFAKLADDQKFKQQALDGLIDQAQSLLDEGKRDEAREQLGALLETEADYEPATSMLASMNQVAKNTSPPRKDPPRDVKKTPPKKKDPPKPKLSREEAKELGKGASKKVFAGDPGGAVSDCKKALTGGYTDCHRIMGLAYKMQGNTSKACSSFKKALRTKPKNAAGIKKQMEQLGCDM